MNEHLKKLALEAGYAAPELAGRMHKLADLIIRDCLEVCEANRIMCARARMKTDDFSEKNIIAAAEVKSSAIGRQLAERYGISDE